MSLRLGCIKKCTIRTGIALGIACALASVDLWYNPDTPNSGLVLALVAAGLLQARILRLITIVREEVSKDPITGLMNRDVFINKLGEIKPSKAEPLGLIFLDLNKFRAVNDTLGHLCGDELLKQTATRLIAMLPLSCIVGRLSGDAFGIIVRGEYVKSISELAKSIADLFYRPYSLSDGMATLGVSIGVAVHSEQVPNAAALIRAADLAMFEAKKTARSYVDYNPKMLNAAEDERYLVNALRNALDHNQLTLEYHPKLDLRTNKLVAIEALLRWNHPVLGKVEPSTFIPIAERRGFIVPITDWVIATALKDLRQAQIAGVALESVCINISASAITQGNLLVSVSKALTQENIEPSSLVLEVTESAIPHKSQELVKVLSCIRLLGVGISIDDFGTGQSSLVYLKYLPATEVKIDRAFVHNLVESQQDYSIVRSIIGLAHDVGCVVCAEGVETLEAKRKLVELDCDLAQGFLISKPVPIQTVIKLALGED